MYNYDKELLAVESYPYPPLVNLRGKVYPSDYVDCYGESINDATYLIVYMLERQGFPTPRLRKSAFPSWMLSRTPRTRNGWQI